MNSSLTPPSICSGSNFSYTPSSPVGGVTFNWVRPAVAGISNTAIVTPQTLNPNEILTNTVTNAVNVIYNYTSSANGCSVTAQVTVAVKPLPTLTVTGGGAICSGALVTLNASGASTYTWNVGPTTSSLAVSPSVTTTYS